MGLTDEQQLVVDTVLSSKNDKIIAINAIAGSGKTSTGEAVIRAYKPNNGFYTAFNKAIVTDSKKRFGDLVESKTIHALAYQHIKPTKSIEDLSYSTIKESCSYEDKAFIIDTLDDFFRSNSSDIHEYAVSKTDNEYLQNIITDYAHAMLEGRIPPTFNYMLKCLHIMMLHKEIEIDFDLFILDECLTEDMLVNTATGDRTIKSIVNDLNKNKEVLVKSFNRTNEIYEYKKASNPLISYNREVVEIKTEGLNKLKCTPNHKILTQRGYVKANDLIMGTDYILLDNPNNQKTKCILNNEQYQVMLGSYLGDGCLQKQSIYNTYRLNFTQGIKQLDYLKWKTDAFNLTNSIKTIKSGYTNKENIFQSKYSPTFILEDTPFNLALKDLNPLGLAIWFMDDGSRYKINSNSFTKEENELLCKMLKDNFSIPSKIIKESNGFYSIHILDEAKLYETIKDYLYPGFEYKFYVEFITEYSYILNNNYKSYGGNFVTSITPIGKHTVYDFEVEGNHNFVTSKSKNSSKTIVHNCQDVTAVTLEIFKLINSDNKLMFGDKYQNIYSFMNTVNAFEELDDLKLLYLTKSFRCNPNIADIVDSYGKKYLDDKFVFKGNEDIISSNISEIAYISRTNGMLIERMYSLLEAGKSFTLTRNINEIFALPIALLNASSGRPVFDKKYKYLEKEYSNYIKVMKDYKSFYEYIIAITEDPVLENVSRMLAAFSMKKINIYDLKTKAQSVKPNPNIILTTAHAFKGLEADNIYLESDLNTSVNKVIMKMMDLQNVALLPTLTDARACLSKEDKEDLNTYYVALSRARTGMLNNDCI